ncbi:cell surface protein [Bacilli bacterium]|nr:cell surface protein [Bacilli bacterium]
MTFMLNKKIKYLSITLMLALLTFGQILAGAITSHAADDNQGQYSIQKVNPKSGEINPEASYYDLKMAPGETKTIEAKILNKGSQEITVKDQVFAAFTNANGQIDYTKQADKYDKSLKIKMSDIAKVKASDINAKVAPGGETTVTVDISLPHDAQTGVILGSWHFEKEGQVDANGKKEGVTINSKYAYALAIKVTVDKEIEKPNLNLSNISVGVVNYKKAFLAELQNDMPAITGKLTIDAKVTAKGKFDTLYENKLEALTFAPNSNYKFPVFLGTDQFKPGEYTYRIKATTDDPKWSSKTWEWNKDFTVLPDEAKKVNSQAINDPRPDKIPTWLYFAIGGLLLLILLLLLLFLLLRKRRKKEKEEDTTNLSSILEFIKEEDTVE